MADLFTLEIARITAWWFLPFVAPICVWVAWSDMARMKIPNKAVLAAWGVFAIVGLIALPLEDYAWRYVHLIAMLAFGFFLNMAGVMGAGDSKFLSAMAPFVGLPDLHPFLAILSLTTIFGLIAHRTLRRLALIQRVCAGWESLTATKFPMGLCLSSTLLFYLLAGALWGQ